MRAAIAVRAGRPEDVAAVVALARATAMAPHWAEAVYAGLMAREAGSGRERRLWVAEWVGEGCAAGCGVGGPVGFAVGSFTPAMGIAELESVVVAETGRRRGVGTALCEVAARWARGRGATEIELEVRAGNEAALAFYGRVGFEAIGRRVGYYGGTEDAILLRLMLGSEVLGGG